MSIESALESFMTDYNNIHEHFPDIPAYELMLNDSIMFKNSKMLTVFSDRYSLLGRRMHSAQRCLRILTFPMAR